MKREEQTQEDARKCGDLLFVAEAMLEIVNEHNRETFETFPPLEVRIGALCCAFCVSCRAAPVERSRHFSLFPISILILISKQNLICVCVCMLVDADALTLSLSLSLSRTHNAGIGTGSVVTGMLGELSKRFSVQGRLNTIEYED
jgi:hypothetical protein